MNDVNSNVNTNEPDENINTNESSENVTTNESAESELYDYVSNFIKNTLRS